MKKWFLDKFPNNSDGQEYFKSVYVDGKHIFDDFKSFSKVDSISSLVLLTSCLYFCNWFEIITIQNYI